MNALVVYCHPDRGSYCHQMKNAVVAGLAQGGHHVDVIDLYADDFDPVMTADEHVAYMANVPKADAHSLNYMSLLKSADTLVFVYPTWWGTLPAMLKGWLEKVLVPGIAFKLDERNTVRPALGAVKRIVGVSTYGSPRWYVRLVTDGGRRSFHRSLRAATGFRARVNWFGFYGIDGSTDVARSNFLASLETKFARL